MFEFFLGYLLGTANNGRSSGSIKIPFSEDIIVGLVGFFVLGIYGLIYINFGDLSCDLTTIDSWLTIYLDLLNFVCEYKTAFNWFYSLSVVIPVLYFIGIFSPKVMLQKFRFYDFGLQLRCDAHSPKKECR